MPTDIVRQQYKEILPELESILAAVLAEVKDVLKGISEIDKVCGRVKTLESFCEKSKELNGKEKKYSNPFKDIQDQIGIRVVVFYERDIDNIRQKIESYFRIIEADEKTRAESEFGYEAIHYTVEIPPKVVSEIIQNVQVEFFELQICTLFQHAWAEANHDIMYKTGHKLDKEEQKKLYWAAAQAWGADKIFTEIISKH